MGPHHADFAWWGWERPSVARVYQRSMGMGSVLIVRLVVIVFLCLSFLPVTSSAQTSATMAGRVTDTSGAMVPGATITARHRQRGIERFAVSDVEGRYVIAALPIGTYDVRVELTGFKPVVRNGLALTVGTAAAVDFALDVGGVVEAVEVVGEASPVNTRTGELSYLVDERAIEQLPLNGRNYTDLAFL